MFEGVTFPRRRVPYPHMLPNETVIWDRFLKRHGDYFEGFEYDVRVGEGIGEPVNLVEPWRSAAIALSRKRIDAVGRRGQEVWLFEVKPEAGLSAIGQLMAYKVLYEDEHGGGVVTHLAIVSDRVDRDTKRAAQAHGIRVYEV